MEGNPAKKSYQISLFFFKEKKKRKEKLFLKLNLPKKLSSTRLRNINLIPFR